MTENCQKIKIILKLSGPKTYTPYLLVLIKSLCENLQQGKPSGTHRRKSWVLDFFAQETPNFCHQGIGLHRTLNICNDARGIYCVPVFLGQKSAPKPEDTSV